MKPIKDLKKLLYAILYGGIFLYASLLVLPYINLQYLNPLNSHSLLFLVQSNSITDSFRYVTILGITLIGFFFVFSLPKNKRSLVIRILFIIVLTLSFFLTAFIYADNYYFVDLLHEGGKFGNAALFLKGKTLYDNLIFFHGAFLDPLIAVTAFMLLGKSIGSYLMITAFFHIIAFVLFFILLSITLKKNLVFYLASLWFYNFVTVSVDIQSINFVIATIRDINVWLMLIVMWFLIKSVSSSKSLFSIIGFLAGSQYFISLDRAYLLTAFIFILFVVSLFITRKRFSSDESLFLFRFNHESIGSNLKTRIYIIFGFVIGFFLQLPIIGINSFKAFLKHAFLEFPQIVTHYMEHVFPSLSESPDSWFPLLVLIFCGSYIIHSFLINYLKRSKKTKYLTEQNLYLLLTFILAVILFRIAINRNDQYHLYYGSTVIFFLIFLILDLIVDDITYAVHFNTLKNVIAFVVISFIIFNYNLPIKSFAANQNNQKVYFFRRPSCYIDSAIRVYQSFVDIYLLNHFRCPPYRKVEDIKSFFSLNKKPDSAWLRQNNIQIVDYMNQNSKEDDFVLVFTNQPGLYYFLNGKSPTRFTLISMADNNLFRKELFNDIKKNQPKLILFTSGSWEEAIENAYVKDRFPEISEWLLKNYPIRTNINNAVILSK